MSLIHTPNLIDKLNNANLLIDTCVIIDASNYDEIHNFLKTLSENKCALLSLPAVKEEFTCSANSIREYQQLSDYIDSLQIIFLNNIEQRYIKDGPVFNIALSRCKNIHPSHVDRVLLSVPYLYRDSSEKIYIITSNHKDVPKELFNRIGFLSYDAGEFRNIGIYEFNFTNFRQKTKDIHK